MEYLCLGWLDFNLKNEEIMKMIKGTKFAIIYAIIAGAVAFQINLEALAGENITSITDVNVNYDNLTDMTSITSNSNDLLINLAGDVSLTETGFIFV